MRDKLIVHTSFLSIYIVGDQVLIGSLLIYSSSIYVALYYNYMPLSSIWASCELYSYVHAQHYNIQSYQYNNNNNKAHSRACNLLL